VHCFGFRHGTLLGGSFEYTPLLLIKVLSFFIVAAARLRIGPRDFIHTRCLSQRRRSNKKKLAPGTKTLHTLIHHLPLLYTHAQSITLWLNPRIMQKKWTCSSLVLLHLPRAAFFSSVASSLGKFYSFHLSRSQPANGYASLLFFSDM